MPETARSLNSSPVITKPEITKKTSTPTKPPVRRGTPAWKRTTSRTAMARRPSTSGRNFRSPGDVPASSPDSWNRVLSGSVVVIWALVQCSRASRSNNGIARRPEVTRPARGGSGKGRLRRNRRWPGHVPQSCGALRVVLPGEPAGKAVACLAWRTRKSDHGVPLGSVSCLHGSQPRLACR